MRFWVVTAMLFLLFGCAQREKLSHLPADAVLLAFGDSITFGTGANSDESYPAVLQRLIGRKVVNEGVPGEFSAEGVARLPEVLDRERPALLILCHGGNDLLGHMDSMVTAANLRAMIKLAREKGVAVVLVGVPAPDLTLMPPKFYGDVAAEFHIPYDSKTLRHILSKGTLKSDHIHPNATGYRMLAEGVAQLLERSGAL